MVQFCLGTNRKESQATKGCEEDLKAFAWPFEKGEVNDLVQEIERQKSPLMEATLASPIS